MDFIIGGYHQGKTSYVLGNYSLKEDDVVFGEELLGTVLQKDANEDIVEEAVYQASNTDRIKCLIKGIDKNIRGKKCLIHFHLLIRQLLEQDIPVEEFLEQFWLENDIQIITSDEIGYGIVPIDAFERNYREVVGRMSCLVAQRADSVVRVVCGIGTRIK